MREWFHSFSGHSGFHDILIKLVITALFTEDTFPRRNRRGVVWAGWGVGGCPMCHPLPFSSIIADPLNTQTGPQPPLLRAECK